MVTIHVALKESTFDTLRPEKNGYQNALTFSIAFFNVSIIFSFKFKWNLLLKVPSTVIQHWFGNQATKDVHQCLTGTQWVNWLRPSDTYICVCDICINGQGLHWFRKLFVRYSAPSRYLNQFWLIYSWTFRNTLCGFLIQCQGIFIDGNSFENAICKMSAILSRLKCVRETFPFGFYMECVNAIK